MKVIMSNIFRWRGNRLTMIMRKRRRRKILKKK